METYLVQNLKKQLREQRQELVKQQQENEKMKKDIKKTKFAEIEIELATYIDECNRLRNVLENTML